MNDGTTLIIATVPGREELAQRALASAMEQSVPFADIIVQTDEERLGPAVTRNRALKKVRTPLAAVLDDDDYLCFHGICSCAKKR